MIPAAVPPRNIGRYEILGRLAIGGMAEVLLGRLRGPHGFERAVVVKRILPHLALDRTVVDMFLDEARIIANLRHPNLINVHELGDDGGEFFIVMDFLEGETASGLCRRLAMREELLDFNVAAHLVAEACAGLHAAHEAKDPAGRSLEIVHRDVSPQNIFVTYAGGVHVIDFGIATAADRVSRTEAGTVRGKFQYLAPEQLQGLPLDRRADVFSLGVVLLELASGRRVYKRENQAATLVAIMSEPAPKLSVLRPGAPAELEEICIKALSKHRRDRFQTAADMRRALLAFARRRSDVDPGESLAKRMHEAFAERIAEKADLLQRVREGSEVAKLPAAEVDQQVEIPAAELATVGTDLSQSMLRLTRVGHRDFRWARGLAVLAIAIVSVLAATMIPKLRPSPAGGPTDVLSAMAMSTAAPSVLSSFGTASAATSPAQGSSAGPAVPSSSVGPTSSAAARAPVHSRPATKPQTPATPKPALTLW
jgi:eukaryotic-like serine/threonine-protein kinase